MDLKTLADSVIAEAKILADDVKSIAAGEGASTVETYLPSLSPFIKALATYAGDASGILALVPVAETVIAVAEAYGVHGEDANQMAEDEAKFHFGNSAD